MRIKSINLVTLISALVLSGASPTLGQETHSEIDRLIAQAGIRLNQTGISEARQFQLTLDEAVETADIFVTTTGNFDIITADHMARMKDKAIVGNIGHFDNEIDMAGLKKYQGVQRINIKPQYDEFKFPDGHSVLVLAEGRLLNLGCATGHPSFVMSASFTNQVIAQIELHVNQGKYEKKVYMLPKHLDEKVASLHLDHLSVKLTRLTKDQSDYIGIPINGPYKPDHYRY